jgi:membrane fusion protein, multidrug efflux system
MDQTIACKPSRSAGGARILGLGAALALASCGGGEAQQKGGRGPSGPAQVGFVVVQPTTAALSTELAGRTAAFETSEVRPQVSGLIRDRSFVEGQLVRAGQTLYRIDPRLFVAQANQARANLQNAQAGLEAARIRAERFRPLAQAQAVSQQEYTDAAAQARQAAAQVAQNRAALETAQVNIDFTRVPAPITGRIGRSLATVGALVTANQTEPLAVIQRLDPMFVDIQQSSGDLLALRRSLAQGEVLPASAGVRLKLEDGTEYAYAGRVQFSEVTVDPATGTVTLRATFPNPDGLLLPGMFVTAVLTQAINARAYLVPQQAVSRDPKGTATVYLVGPNNRAVQRQVQADRTQGPYWVVTRGLNPGDRVITQGLGRLRPNAEIRPVPATAPQRVAPPPPGTGAPQSKAR